MSETGKLRKSKTLKDKKSISWFNFERIFKFRRKTPNSLQKSTEKLPLSESTNTTPSKPKREAQFEVKNERETQPQSNENADSRNYFKEIETPQTSNAGVTRPPRPSHNSQSKTSWSVQLRDRVGPRPSRPESSKPFLSEDARNYSSQLNLRCSMPILNPEGLTFSCFPREMAVDVGFAKAENDRWKRHSIAVTFQEPESQNTATMKESKRLSNNTTIREKVLHELLQSERDYVRHLRGVINGYLITCENKKEFFSEDDLLLIFGNLKEIMVFQQNFLQKLETAYEQEQSVEHIGNV
ncbi:Oidioi.mRNA.OKI2018_I69.XSR.g16285.t1.cds [Oikopleura dioica]|uniref:Oidioi.mRNA.OKI2018_I69.XSR.g16285.t1.cds n=1 Tax=Oikopleura dioica TaxID=34765 RepID=A0ABN7SPX8_OIKDI|nr:Oidioi.mRNA.OKI2018_I69.XSR.g16285.t1.cds [Oikopleura dioica]